MVNFPVATRLWWASEHTYTFYSAELVCIIYKAKDLFVLIRRFYWFINELFITFTDDLNDLSSLSFPKIIKKKRDGHLILLD